MDFIERIVGVSPDAGAGTLEALLVLVPLLLLAMRRVRRRTPQ